MNPYREIKDLYVPATIKAYNGKSLGEMPPHVFAIGNIYYYYNYYYSLLIKNKYIHIIADKAIRDMRVYKASQSIIVSGESGAGKTESTKYLLKYLCHMQDSAGPIEQKILDGKYLN